MGLSVKLVNNFYPLNTLAKISIFDVGLGSKCTSALKYDKVIRTSLSEAAARGVLCKKVFLEISQISQENTCARVSFLIKSGLRPATLL